MRRFTSTAIVVAIGLTLNVGVMAQTMSSWDFQSSMDSIATQYISNKVSCESLSTNASITCMAEARSIEEVAEADLVARSENTIRSHYEALITKAEADHAVAKKMCDDLSGNAKDICQKDAKASEIAAIADAKAHIRTSSGGKIMPNEKSAEAKNRAENTSSAAVPSRRYGQEGDSEFSVVKEWCNTLAGGAKGKCLNEANVRVNKCKSQTDRRRANLLMHFGVLGAQSLRSHDVLVGRLQKNCTRTPHRGTFF